LLQNIRLKIRAKNIKSSGKKVLEKDKDFRLKFLQIMRMLLIFPIVLEILRTEILTQNSSGCKQKKNVALKEHFSNNGNTSTTKFFRISGG
jgi:hypothetical protein